jgi:hypothetical protein
MDELKTALYVNINKKMHKKSPKKLHLVYLLQYNIRSSPKINLFCTVIAMKFHRIQNDK